MSNLLYSLYYSFYLAITKANNIGIERIYTIISSTYYEELTRKKRTYRKEEDVYAKLARAI